MSQAQTAPTKSIAGLSPDSKKQIGRSEEQELCGQGIYDSSEDLCAQWKAADMAAEAARWAWWQLWLSAFGIVGLSVTLWFNFRALRLAEKEAAETKGALAIAAKNAQAAQRIAEITEDSANKELRAYITVSQPKLLFDESTNEIVGIVGMKNVGRTPAIDVDIWLRISGGPSGVYGHILNMKRIKAGMSMTTVGPNDEIYWTEARCKLSLPIKNFDDLICSGQAELLMVVNVTYKDVGGKEHETAAAFVRDQYCVGKSAFTVGTYSEGNWMT